MKNIPDCDGDCAFCKIPIEDIPESWNCRMVEYYKKHGWELIE